MHFCTPFMPYAQYPLLNQSAIRDLSLGNHDCRRHAVAGLDLQEADALCGTSRLTDELRFNADDLPVLADQHHFGLLRDLRNPDDFPVTLGGLDVDHARPPAALQTVFVGCRSLAE